MNPSTTIQYKGFNESMEQNIRWYMAECENITREMYSRFFVPEGREEGIRSIVFNGTMTHGETLELEDMGQMYELTIHTKE